MGAFPGQTDAGPSPPAVRARGGGWGGQGTASPVPRLPWSCSDRAVPSGPDRGPRSLPDPRPSAALTGPSVLPLSFAGSTRSPSRGGGAAALQVWPEVAKAVGPSCACQVRGRVPPQSDAGLGWSRSRRGPCGPHGGASGVPSVPAAEAAGPRATVLGPPLAGRSRLTHTEQVCCQRAFQVSTWRPFPRRGRGRPATPPSVSPQTRGAGCRATRTARATRDREKAGGVAPAGPGPPWLGGSLHCAVARRKTFSCLLKTGPRLAASAACWG